MATGSLTPRDLGRLLDLVHGVERFRIDESRRLELDGAAAVWRELAALKIENGWLTLHDRVLIFTTPMTIPAEDATPLEGELRLDEHTSAHLRHLGEARWRLTWLCRVDDPEACGTRRSFFAAGSDRTLRLGYEVEWRLVADVLGQPVLHPFRSRFTGFERSKG